MSSLDLQTIKERYTKYLEEAQAKGRHGLPNYEIALWDQVLNPLEFKMFEDIRYIGVPLYPIFPVLENSYLHFANPFKKIGIEIKYKESPQSLIDRKIGLLSASGWTIHVIKSQGSYHTIEEYFRIKRKRKDVEFDDLSFEEQYRFVSKFKEESAPCLLYYINWTYFFEVIYKTDTY